MSRVSGAIFAGLVALAQTKTTSAIGAEVQGLSSLPEVEFSQISQRDESPLGAIALAIHPQDWKHGETEHFIYHYQKSYVATPVSVEAEFYFRVIAQELMKEHVPWPEKAHIYIFEQPADWASFQSNGELEPWTGGIQSAGSLFVVRNPAYKFSDNTLGHEIVHLVLFRFYGAEIPLWLNEGFAQFASKDAHAGYQRARGYAAKPRSHAIGVGELVPLTTLTIMGYPAAERVETFYDESERFVRFLIFKDRPEFLALLDALARGQPFEAAFSHTFGPHFGGIQSCEAEFKKYAGAEGAD
ncbi:MAG: hypothetical protein ABI871_04030 [Chthoniobacterales bacterium]